MVRHIEDRRDAILPMSHCDLHGHYVQHWSRQ
jgi:hypothetical protein